MTNVKYNHREHYLEWKEIEKLDLSSEILVNSNRLYWMLSEIKRTTNNLSKVKILRKNILQIEDERKMFVPMKVDEVRMCFNMCKDELPINTFRELPCSRSGKTTNRKTAKNHTSLENAVC